MLDRRYELQHVVRTHMGAQDNSYGCVFQREDEAGKVSYLPQSVSSLFQRCFLLLSARQFFLSTGQPLEDVLP